MRADEVMNTVVIRVAGGIAIRQIADLMRREGVGIVCVCDHNNRPRGVITDRDIVVRVVAKGRSIEHTRAEEVMSTHLISCQTGADLAEVGLVMRNKRTGRVLVLNDERQLVGIITLAEIWHYESPFEAAPVSRTVTEREFRAQTSGGHFSGDDHDELAPLVEGAIFDEAGPRTTASFSSSVSK